VLAFQSNVVVTVADECEASRSRSTSWRPTLSTPSAALRQAGRDHDYAVAG